ncbi:MAG: ABC transporter substrate-binding protein [Acidimicrobiia bacterium]|nr:ABC transporter substrate-binding protein [Acidimicrobiia bacterium]
MAGLLAAACGRGDDDEATGSTDPGETTSPTTGGPAQEAAGVFADLGAICGPTPEGMTLGEPDVGVTAESVQVGTISDPGFSGRPGLNQELFDTAAAFTQWCNAAGGINGRRIELRERDAKLTEHQGRMIDACEEGDFMLVGGGGVFDDQGQKERLACGLPQIPGYVVTASAIESDLTVQPVPNPVYSLPIGDLRWLGEQYPEATKKIGLLVLGVASTIAVAERYEEALAKLGWEVVYNEQYNAAGEVSWRGYAEGLKSSGARGVIWLGEPVNLAAVRKAMDEIEYHPDFVRTDANHYDDLLLSEGGSAVDNTFIRGTIYPFLDPELAAQNPATQAMLDIMAEYEPGGKVAYLGVMGFSGWLLFAKSATECGADLTRDCLWEKVQAVTDWSGAGLHAPQDLASRTASGCFMVIEARDGEFVLPDIGADEGIYRCDPDDTLALTGDYGEGAKCENPAFADDPKPSNCAP